MAMLETGSSQGILNKLNPISTAGAADVITIPTSPTPNFDTTQQVDTILSVAGDPNDWSFWYDTVGEFGGSVLRMAAEVPDLLGNLIEWGDRRITIGNMFEADDDDTDLASRGAKALNNFADWVASGADQTWAGEGSAYVPMDFDRALEAAAGKSGESGMERAWPMLKFVRDTFPQAAAYLGAAFLLGGVPLGASEFNRTLEDRMSNKGEGLGAADASPEDIGMASVAAFLNVFLERFPWMVNLSNAAKNKKFGFGRFIALEEVTEFGQGAAEEFLTTVDTIKGVDFNNVLKQGLAEMIGALGVVVPSAGFAKSRHGRIHEEYVAKQARQEEIAQGRIDAENQLSDEIKALELQIRDGKKKSQIPDKHEYIKSRRAKIRQKKAAIKALRKARKDEVEARLSEAAALFEPVEAEAEAVTEEAPSIAMPEPGPATETKEDRRNIREAWRQQQRDAYERGDRIPIVTEPVADTAEAARLGAQAYTTDVGLAVGAPADTTRLAEIEAARAAAIEEGRRALPRRDITQEEIDSAVQVDLTQSDLEAQRNRVSDAIIDEVVMEPEGPSMEVLPGESIAQARERIYGDLSKRPDFYIDENGIPTIVIRGMPTPVEEVIPDEDVIQTGPAAGPAQIARAIETQNEAITQQAMDTGAAAKLAEVRDISNRAQANQMAARNRAWNVRRRQRAAERAREVEVARQTQLADENARAILFRIANEDAEANITIDEFAQKYTTIENQVGEDYARIYYEELSRLAQVYGKVIKQEDIAARGPDVVGRSGPAELGFGIDSETGQLTEIAIEEPTTEIAELERIIAEQESLINTMVGHGITTDAEIPQAYSIPELQQQLEEKAANEEKLNRLKAEIVEEPPGAPVIPEAEARELGAAEQVAELGEATTVAVPEVEVEEAIRPEVPPLREQLAAEEVADEEGAIAEEEITQEEIDAGTFTPIDVAIAEARDGAFADMEVLVERGISPANRKRFFNAAEKEIRLRNGDEAADAYKETATFLQERTIARETQAEILEPPTTREPEPRPIVAGEGDRSITERVIDTIIPPAEAKGTVVTKPVSPASEEKIIDEEEAAPKAKPVITGETTPPAPPTPEDDQVVEAAPKSTRWRTSDDGNSRTTTLQGKPAEVFKSPADDAYRAVYDGEVLDKLYKTLEEAKNALVLDYGIEPQIQYVKNQQAAAKQQAAEKRDLKKTRAKAREPGPLPFIERTVNEQGVPVQIIEEAEEFTLVIDGNPHETYATRRRAVNAATKIALGDLSASLRKQIRALTAGKRKLVRGAAAPLRETARGLRETARVAGRIQATEAREIAGTRTEKARLAPQQFINHWPGKNYKQYIGPVPKSDTATARPNVSRRRVGDRWEVVVNYPGASRLKFNEDFTMFSLQNGGGAQNIVDSIKANAQLFKDSLVAAYQAGDLRRRQSPVDASRNEVVSGEMNDSFFERWVGALEEADSPQAAEVSQAWTDKEVATTEEVATEDTFEADQAAEKEDVLLQAEQAKADTAEIRAKERADEEARRTRVTTGKKKVESKVVSIEGENYLKLAEQLNIIRQRLDAGEKLNESDQRVVNHALFDQRVVDDELDIEGEPATVFMELNPTMHGMFSSSVEERVDDLFDGLNFLDHDSLEQAQEDLEVIISHANLAWKEPSLAVVPTETTPKLTPPIGFKKGIRIPKGFKKKYAHLDPDVFYNLASEAEKRGIVDPLEFDNFITSNLRIIETEAKQRAKEQVVTDADLAFELTDWAGADEIADFNAQAVKDAQAKKTKKKADKVNPLAILLETPETLLTNLKKTSLYKVGDLQDLAENIKEITPTFIVARKRSALVESIMDWHALQNLQEKATAEEIGAAIEKLQDNITKDNFIEDDINGDIKTIRASGRADIVMPFANPEQVINMFVKELNGIFGVRAVNKMRADSFITFLPNSVAPYAVKAYGVTIPKDTAAFVVGGVDSEGPIAQVSFMHENIAKHFGQESVRGIIMHELGVHYGKRMLEGPEWSNVLSTVKKLWYDGDRDIRAATWVAMLNNYPEYMGMLGGGRLKAGTLKQFNALNKVIEGKHLEDDTRPGTMITGDGVVTRDMHGDVIPPESGGWQMPNLSLNFEAGRIFWEEVLAEYITANPPTRIRVKPSLWRQIQEAARKFFVRMAELFSPTPGFKGPDITTRDLQDMVAYMVQNVPSQQKYESSLRQSGDNKRVADKRNQARAKFLEGSVITTPVYHANKNWKYHFPIIDRMELGMHFSGVDSALMMIARSSSERYSSISEVPEGKIRSINEESALYDPWIPEQLKSLTNRDLEGIAIMWGDSHLVDKSKGEPRVVFRINNVAWNPDLKEYMFKQENGVEIPLSTLTRQRADNIYVFEKGAQLKEFYINIKNPLILNSSLNNYADPGDWMKYANLRESRIKHLGFDSPTLWDDTVEKQMSPENFKKFQKFIDKASVQKEDAFRAIDDRVDNEQITYPEGESLKVKMIGSFGTGIRKMFQSMGYDSLQVVNFIEVSHTIEYIIFDDSNIKSSDSLEYTPEKMSLNLIRSIDDTVKDEKAIMAPGTESTTRALIQSAIGEGKLRSGLQSIQRAIEPLLTVPGFDLLETQRMLTKGEIWSWENTGRITFDVLNEANPKEKKVIFKYFTEQGASPDGLPDRDIEIATRRTVLGGTRKKGAFHSPTEKINMKAKVIETKEIIENMGEELVGLGLISPDQFAALRGKYLPQLYMSYVFGDQARKTIGYGFKASSLDYTRARKVYGTWMEELIHGKIEDPAFLSSRYQTMVGRDIGIIKLLNYISTDPGGFNWVLPNQLIEINGMKGTPMYFRHEAEGMEYRADIIEEGGDSARATATRALAKKFREASARHLPAENVDSKRYRRVPDTPRYGTMRGMWIVREIYDDMIAPGESFSDQNLAQSLLSDRGLGATITRVFKYTRVPMNPPTQARNLISNTILLHTSGVALHRLPGRIVQAMNDILHDGKYSQLARKYGIESTTFSSQEIGRIDAEFAKIKASEKSWEGMKARGKIFFDEWLDVGGRAYQKSEVLFKVAKMIDMMESKGATEGEAAIAANKAILDYSSVSQGLRWLRKVPFGSPFITFNAKVMFQLARNLQDNPVSFLPYVALPFLLAEALLAEQDDLDDDDIEKLRGMLPEWAEDQGGMYFLPWKDAHGRWRALNIGYMLPWNSHLEIAKNAWKGEFKKSWGASGMMTGPYNAFQGLVNNKDFFTGNEIYNEADSPMQQYQDILMFISSNMIPPFLTPRNRSGNIVTGGGPVIKLLQAYGVMDGNIDRYGLPRVTVPQAYMSMVGLNTYNFNEFAVKEKQRKKMYEVREILDRMRSLMMQTRDPRKREEIRAEYLKLAGKKMIEVREWVAMMQGYEKLFGATQ